MFITGSAIPISSLCDLVSGKIADLLAAQRAIQTMLRSVSEKGKRIIKRKAGD